MRVVVLCALVACTYPEKELQAPMDAGPLSCFGAMPPTTADPLVMITGTTTEPLNLTAVGFVTVALQDATMSTISTTTSDINGRFSISLNTNGSPVTGLDLYASAVGRISTYYFPSRPVTQNLEIALAVISSSESTSLQMGAGLTFTPGDGQVLLAIDDCFGGLQSGISGATLASSPAGTVRYFDGIQPSTTLTATEGGVAMMANLPPGKVTLTATDGTMTFPPRTVTAVADAFTLTEIQP